MTSCFFVVSGYNCNKMWYDRCKFSGRPIHCVLINYPAREESNWANLDLHKLEAKTFREPCGWCPYRREARVGPGDFT